MFRSVLLATTFLALAGCSSLDSVRNAPAANSSTQSQDEPLEHLPALKGDYFKIASRETGRTYYIYVRFPDGYDSVSEKKYPVIYLLDGDSLFPLLAPTHLFLTYDENLPEAIIVGIAYGGFDRTVNNRHVDFSAPASDAPPGEDGAPKFLSFLKQELIPRTEGRYRVDATKRVLLGQSRGGYFVLWSALEDPDLFWGRIASNPSLSPGREQFFAAAKPHSRNDLQVAVASGTRDTEQRQKNAREWTRIWKGRSDAPWDVRLLPIQDGTHAASIGETYRQAMLWLFRQDIAQADAEKS